MSVVVIIPVYNRAGLIFDAINSVVNQTKLPDEIILVDDGSTDGFSQEFSAWEEKNLSTGCPITFIQQPNQGAAIARNTGIKTSPGADWYAFLDSDDLWPPDFLERCLALISHSRHIKAATVDREESSSRHKTTRLVDMSKLVRDPQAWMFQHGAALLSGTLLKGDAVRELNGFPEGEPFYTGQDLFFLLRVANSGEWVHVPGAPYNYRSDLGFPQLHEAFSDSRHRWANIFEQFYKEIGETDSARESLFRKLLAKRWREAGDQHRLSGRKALSLEAYKRSNKYHRNVRAVLGAIRLKFQRVDNA